MRPEDLMILSESIYHIRISNRCYIAIRFQGEEISVRIPLEVWSAENPTLLGPYAEELLRKIMKLANSKAAITKASLTLPM